MSVQTEIARIAQAKTDIKNVVNSKVANTITNQTIDAFPPLIDSSIAAYKNLIPWIEGSGSSFTIDNAEAGKLDKFEMYGNTEQTTYTGKNLSYCDRVSAHGITFEGNDINIVNPTDYLYAINKWNIGNNSNLSGKTYTIYTLANGTTGDKNIDLEIGKTGNMYAYQHKLNANTTYKDNLKVQTITLGDEDVFTRIDVYVSGSTTANVNFKVMIVEGSYTAQTIGDFEPYVGETPSPNPDYPQDVRVVTGNNSVKVAGKNLFDISTITLNKTIDLNTGEVNVNANNRNTSDFILVTNSVTYSCNVSMTRVACYDENKNFISSTTIASSIITPSNCKYIRFSYDNTLTNIQFERGLSTEFTLYAKTYPINLGTMELCKIRTYQDYIYKSNSKWYKHSEIGKVVLDGDETWGNEYGVNLFNLNDCIYFMKGTPALSNYYKYNSIQSGLSGGLPNREFALQYSSHRLFIKNTNYSTATDFKNWLSTHNTIVYYVLETPTNEEITDTTLISQLNAIETYTGTNIFSVSNSNGVLPDLYVLTEKQNSYKN